MIDRLELPPVAPSMICAGCDGEKVVTKDAIGRERIRCPKCDGVSRIVPHPDDVHLPQGLVKASDAPPRILHQIVRVEVPGEPQIITQLPPIGAGQIRCQLCARGVHPSYRWCAHCSAGGALILQRADVSRQSRRPGAERRYAPKPCKWEEDGVRCGRQFHPSGPRSDYCPPHSHAAYQRAQAARGARATRRRTAR